jgi:hypothetical protein
MEKKITQFDFLKIYNGTYTSLEKLLPIEITLEYMNEFLKHVHKVQADKDLYRDLETYEKEKERYSSVSLKAKFLYFGVHLSHCFHRKDRTVKDFVPCEKRPYIWLDFNIKDTVKLVNGNFKFVNVIVHIVKSVREMEMCKFHFGNQVDPDHYFQFSYRRDQNPPAVQFIRSHPMINDCIILITMDLNFFGCFCNQLTELTTNHFFC